MSDQLLGDGGARKAAKAIRNRKVQIDESLEDTKSSNPTPKSTPSKPMKDASKGAYKDHQMQEAIKMMRAKKSANRSDYE